jgi:hypothetical protein
MNWLNQITRTDLVLIHRAARNGLLTQELKPIIIQAMHKVLQTPYSNRRFHWRARLILRILDPRATYMEGLMPRETLANTRPIRKRDHDITQ